MISMKSKRPFKVDFFWIGSVPDDNRLPGETNGHHTFFIECMSCDRRYNSHLLKCNSEAELAKLFSLYAERLVNVLPFKVFPEDFLALASNTWKDEEYQRARVKR